MGIRIAFGSCIYYTVFDSHQVNIDKITSSSIIQEEISAGVKAKDTLATITMTVPKKFGLSILYSTPYLRFRYMEKSFFVFSFSG